jgi:16S rRNA (adenine1518-N6/adenine1519-N6)-dimethyltransferase
MTAPRQTLSFLRNRFEEVGINPTNKFGQNFLIDLNLVELLVSSGRIDGHDVVLEVGTGTGSLTAMMAARAGAVITVEIDPQLHALASEELAGFDNVTMLHQDALKNKNNLHPTVIETISQRLGEIDGAQFKLVANLPYNIATPILSNLLSTPVIPRLMVATIQKELAERIIARPGSKDYGALSIWMQSQCEVEIVRIMPPSVFWPRPKVDSAIVQITPVAEKRAAIADPEFFHQFVRAMFFHRRKFTRANVLAAFKGKLDKPEVDHLLESLGHEANTRSEQLSVDQMLEMSDLFRERVPGGMS